MAFLRVATQCLTLVITTYFMMDFQGTDAEACCPIFLPNPDQRRKPLGVAVYRDRTIRMLFCFSAARRQHWDTPRKSDVGFDLLERSNLRARR